MKGGARWLTAVLGTTVAVAAVAALGYYPTLRLAGGAGRGALLAGCLVGLAANWLGLVSLRWTRFDDPSRRAAAVLTAMAVRFVVVLLLAVAAALSGRFELGPLLVWVVISYLVALFVETLWLVQTQASGTETDR